MSCLPCEAAARAAAEKAQAQSPYTSSGPVQSSNDCSATTVSLLQMYKYLLDCVVTNNLYVPVNTTSSEVQSALGLLNDWIAQKELDPTTCIYQEKLPLLQAIVNRIVAYGRC